MRYLLSLFSKVLLSTKPKFNSLSIWSSKVDRKDYTIVENELRELLSLSKHISVEYKDHGGAIINNHIKRGGNDGALPGRSVYIVKGLTSDAADLDVIDPGNFNRPSPTLYALVD